MDRSDLVDRAIELLHPLLGYARNRLRVYEALGDLPPGQVEPEEVVNAGLAEALRRAGEAPGDRPYPWLRRFVRRAIERQLADARLRRRERSLEEPVGTGWPDEEGTRPPRRLIDVLPDPNAPIPEDVVTRAEILEALAALINELPETWREPFLLHGFDGRSLEEVAWLEGVTVEEVRRRIEQARAYLRARLAEEYEEAAVPPSETLFAALERAEPTAEQIARVRGRLEAGAA